MVDRYQQIIDECHQATLSVNETEAALSLMIEQNATLVQFLKDNDLGTGIDQVTSHLRRNGMACMPNDAHRHYLKARKYIKKIKDAKFLQWECSNRAMASRTWKSFIEDNKFSRYSSIKSNSYDCNLRGNYSLWVTDIKIIASLVSIPEWAHVIVPNHKTADLWGDKEDNVLEELNAEIFHIFSSTPYSFPPRLREAVQLLPNFSWPEGKEITSSWPISYYYNPQIGNDKEVDDPYGMLKESGKNIETLTILALTLIRDVFMTAKRSVDEDSKVPANKRSKQGDV